MLPGSDGSRSNSAIPRLESTPPTPGHPQVITFIDTQNPNRRSEIQRHTAHHSNAQRRTARLQLLRSTRPRLLEWQRRPSGETAVIATTSPNGSASSTSVSPAPLLRTCLSAPAQLVTTATKNDEPDDSNIQVEEGGQIPQITTSHLTDELFTTYIRQLCPYICIDRIRQLTKYVTDLDVCARMLLLAIIHLTLNLSNSNRLPSSVTDCLEPQQLYGWATRLLRVKLTCSETATSDANIQAVLLLIAYASDIGSTDEVQIHTTALSRMIEQRGGTQRIHAESDPILVSQLTTIVTSRTSHLTLDCDKRCTYNLRFPNGVEISGSINS